MEAVQKKLMELACQNFSVSAIELNKNLFEYDIDAFKLLYFVMDIKENFNVSIERIFDQTNYTFLTLNNIAKKYVNKLGIKQ